MRQPPLGGCVLKLKLGDTLGALMTQPPLGGCVLKLPKPMRLPVAVVPAAFRRLCVETENPFLMSSFQHSQPPLGGCVLKQEYLQDPKGRPNQPPLGGCVLKHKIRRQLSVKKSQPPLGGCVLKPKR